MATTSTSARVTRSWVLSNASGTPKRRLAASAESRRVVDSAVISKSSESDRNAGMCACAAQPRSGLAPMMPTRILLVPLLVIAVSPARRRFLNHPARLPHALVGGATEDRIERTSERSGRIGDEIVAAPGDVEVRSDEHASALGHLAERGPVVVEVEHVASRTDPAPRD